MIFSIYLFIYTLQIILTLPHFVATCSKKTLQSYALQFFHHLFDVFLFWSIFFLNQRIEQIAHFVLVLVIMIHWFSQNNRCIATVLMNRECGYPEDQWLDSLKNMFGLRSISEYFHFIWVGALVLYDLYRIG